MTVLCIKLAQTRQGLPSMQSFMHPIRSCLPHDLSQCQPHPQQEDAERDAAEAAYKVCTPTCEHVSFTAQKKRPNRPALSAGHAKLATPQGILQHCCLCTVQAQLPTHQRSGPQSHEPQNCVGTSCRLVAVRVL